MIRSLYICGSLETRAGFMQAASRLRRAGFDVHMPMALEKCGWINDTRTDLLTLLKCDGLALLGEPLSDSAKLEVLLAQHVGMPVKAVSMWAAGGPQ